MCGIAGCIAPGTFPRGRVEAMTQALARRGPDSEGLEEWPGVALGHRRLAILDLSPAGHQPMLSEDRSIGVVFNGCIYNFLDLRAELERSGRHFRSRCDTEVLLHGYSEWGVDGLAKRLRGMFAFGVWDEPRRSLTLVRDRLGVKPLLWTTAPGGGIAFASTATALHRAGFGDNELDPAAVVDFLEYGWVTEERCIWKGVQKLPPASILEWKDGRIEQRRYWDLNGIGQAKVSFEEAVEETERLLVESVRLRLYADVPEGVLLSGGIDSGLVCWAMAEANAKVTAFTVGAPGDPADEAAGAKVTAERLGIRHEVVTLADEGPSLDVLTEAYGEPFACSSALGMLRVSQAVKPHATVLLTGDGGDDVFLGYEAFGVARLAQRFARGCPPGADAVWKAVRGLVPKVGLAGRAKTFLNAAMEGAGAFRRAQEGWPYYEREKVLGARLQGARVADREMPGSLRAARRQVEELFALHRRLHFTSEFMPKVDGGTMHYALEARAPFLDHKVWEFAATLPEEVRLRGGELKAVLREIARRRIGAAVAARPKQGFTIPVERWLAQQWAPALQELKHGTMLERQGWVEGSRLSVLAEQASGRGQVPLQLWNLLVLEHWLRGFSAGKG